MSVAATPWWVDVITIVASLIALGGQLALIRLALGPSVTVGGAIAHGLRRLPVYIVSVILIVICLVICLIPIAVILAALGVKVSARGAPPNAATMIAGLIYFAIVCFVGVRMLMAAPVASAEHRGPIAILKRSWALTKGNFWPLFGFLVAFVIGAIIVLLAIGSALGVVIRLTFGAMEPMSAAALVFALVQALVSAAITALFAVMLARIYLQLAGDREQVESVFR
jgi:hypothetical protein